jgi:hypothetical protein
MPNNLVLRMNPNVTINQQLIGINTLICIYLTASPTVK